MTYVTHWTRMRNKDVAGVILSSVLRNADGKSQFILVLDARTFKEVARVEFEGVDMHKDIHGIFAPFSSPHTH